MPRVKYTPEVASITHSMAVTERPNLNFPPKESVDPFMGKSPTGLYKVVRTILAPHPD